MGFFSFGLISIGWHTSTRSKKKKFFGRNYVGMGLAMSIFVGDVVRASDPESHLTLQIRMDDALCTDSGECSLDVSDIALDLLELCEAPHLTLNWNQKTPGAFLLACDCNCTSHDNTGWLVENYSIQALPKITELSLGRRFTLQALRRSPSSILDALSSSPLCELLDVEKTEVGVFVSMIKRPAKTENATYCYYPVYIVVRGEQLEIETHDEDDGYGRALVFERRDEAAQASIIKLLNDLATKVY
ncbi:hypothetical protein [Pseudomonas sp. LS-2]|jgi:hypothetical protein|uniref:hypothetical protein n=1 Tax=Pseudomonas sp. LS-2 TaxID=2315859 RepID=UPI000E743FA1|nr:hypothetical protein [Pseudomonas sp. LS-2]RJX74081.1 hypothetical protein D3M70_27640 [Pseudomonas sp. LS-2]